MPQSRQHQASKAQVGQYLTQALHAGMHTGDIVVASAGAYMIAMPWLLLSDVLQIGEHPYFT